jgi:hypothetical protein
MMSFRSFGQSHSVGRGERERSYPQEEKHGSTYIIVA